MSARYLAGMRVVTSPILAVLLALSGIAAAMTFDASARSPAVLPDGPVLVELFTSQGCSSCPPADRLLGRLAGEKGVVALGYHVTYWDRLGWPDPFATAWGTRRQYGYGETVSAGRIYTPQIVIDGRTHVVGSSEGQVRAEIAAASRGLHPATPVLRWMPDNRLQIVLPDAAEAAGAEIWLVRFDRRRETAVQRGENGGRRLANFQVARERVSLGRFDGRARTLEAAVPSQGDAGWGVAVIVQQPGPGRVWGSALLDAPRPDA